MASSPRRASAAEAASSKTFHQRALRSRWWRSGSFAVTHRSAWTVQRCWSAVGHSCRIAFQRRGAPSATIGAGAFSPRSTRSRPNASHAAWLSRLPSCSPSSTLRPSSVTPQATSTPSAGVSSGVQPQLDRVTEQVDQVAGRPASEGTSAGSARACPRRSATRSTSRPPARRRSPPARPRRRGPTARAGTSRSPASPAHGRGRRPCQRSVTRTRGPRRLAAALIAATADELRHPVLHRLLNDQPRAEARNLLDRILAAFDPDQPVVEPAAQPLARGYSRLHSGRSPRFVSQDQAEATPGSTFPAYWDGTIGPAQGVCGEVDRPHERPGQSGLSHEPLDLLVEDRGLLAVRKVRNVGRHVDDPPSVLGVSSTTRGS